MAGGSDSEPSSPRLGLSELSADTLAALQHVQNNPDEVCPAGWKPG